MNGKNGGKFELHVKKNARVADELAEFLATPGSSASENVQRERPPVALFERVSKDIRPSVGRIASRLLVVHALAGALTLTVCPQFGIGPIGGGHGLMGIFMEFGDLACAAGCGSFFMGATVLSALMVLSPDEIRVIRNQGSGLAYWSGLVALSVAVFMLGGSASEASLSYIGVWGFAGVLVGALSFQINRFMRSRALS